MDVVEANKRRRNDSTSAKKRITIQNERLDRWRKEISEWDDEWVKVNGHEKQKGEELLDSEVRMRRRIREGGISISW